MKALSRREVKFGAWFVAAVAIAIAAFFIGQSLKPEEPPHYVFRTEAPAYDAPVTIPATTQGGFTGFGESDGSLARTVIAGKVVEKTDTTLVLETPGGQRTSLRFASSPNISRVENGARAMLQPGVTVSVRLAADDPDVVEAVMIVSRP
ncbi:MAG TPA: hypothetical protein VFX19_02910 [Dehalococcoidia bacterium]|nr:hypothetical protein [Dehalococcoidia bacterium]